MNILSQDGKVLINYDNVKILYIGEYMNETNNNEYEHRYAIMVNLDSTKNWFLTDNYLATFDNEEDCIKVFNKLLDAIYRNTSHFIRIKDLCEEYVEEEVIDVKEYLSNLLNCDVNAMSTYEVFEKIKEIWNTLE